MAAFGKTLERNTIGVIFSFLDDSSLATTYPSNAPEIANLNALRNMDELQCSLCSVHRHNRCVEFQLYEDSL